jgi:hypothetical protein
VRKIAFTLPLFLIAACGNSGGISASKTEAPASSAMLPDRLLRCTLGRALNLDPGKTQTVAEIKYEGVHSFSLFLPSVPTRTSEPPDPTLPAEPVNPATRITSDPSGLTKSVPSGFDRVVDYWPERVELTRTVNEPLVNLIVVSDIDVIKGSANLFMTQATDAVTFDLKHVYQGGCSVITGKDARLGAQAGPNGTK